jgi:hypothetical protein
MAASSRSSSRPRARLPADAREFIPPTQSFVNRHFQPRAGATSYRGALIVIFTYFYTAVQFNPVDQADNLRKYGGYIPASVPGPPTAQYLDRVLTRLTLPGSIYLALVAVLPSLFIRYGGFSQATSRALGGTSVLIVVGVRARHDASDGVADDDALLRRLPEIGVNILLLGAAGVRQGNAGQADLAEYGSRTSRRATCSAAAIASGTPLGLEVKPILDRGELVPGRADDRPDPRAAGGARRRRGFVLDGFPRTMARPTPSTRCCGDRP